MPTAYETFEHIKDVSLLARICYRLSVALLGREKCRAAFLGSSALSKMEILRDCGFWLENERESFFGENCKSWMNLYHPLDHFDPQPFDVIVISEEDPSKNRRIKQKIAPVHKQLIFDLDEMATYFRTALKSIRSEHFFSCLNINKLAAIALLTYLCPNGRNIAEIGSYRCGTTLFMAKMIQLMDKTCKIFAFDTFYGLPPPTERDQGGMFCFEKGMFSNNSLPFVKELLEAEGVLNQIALYQGLFHETVMQASVKEWNVYLAFIDTDQYQGTKDGLEHILKAHQEGPLFIIVGDTIVEGVNRAIQEVIEKQDNLRRSNLCTNFDLVFSKEMCIAN